MQSFSLSVDSPDAPSGTESAMNARMNSPYYHTPILRIVSSLPILAVSSLLIPAAVMVTGPNSADQYSLIGALVAAVITLVAVRKYDQTFANSLCAILGSLLVGVTLPGALVSWAQWKGLIDDNSFTHLSWHTWVIAGLVCGLGGWVGAQSIYQLFTRIIPGFSDKVENKVSKFLTPADKTDKHEK